ncbi:hypothetical protein STRCI_000157 [Streptomyces cinnabarinus]|uniref:Uncharacterized protein n=1 Tax=Streptomyces cinnabarinus TaxID=67287 RepID=A0ABY7K3S9_9ACTN|nr:hypothetical protein [Streptomyces cinnabarinus]WAZ19127.1 hypothetical protein STRCI_000157 [Streptomyces cinnabarinus]
MELLDARRLVTVAGGAGVGKSALAATVADRVAVRAVQLRWQAARKIPSDSLTTAVLAGDDATLGRLAHVEGMLALGDGDPHAAAAHFAYAAATMPVAPASAGPSSAVSLAALAVTQSAFAPGAALNAARRALSQPGIRDDAWSGLLAAYARAVVDHRHGHPGRAWRRARRALVALDTDHDPELPTPHGRAALCRLIADLESGGVERNAAGGLPAPFLPSLHPATTLAAARTASAVRT